MYIEWGKIFNSIALFTPLKFRKAVRQTGSNLKYKRNLKYIAKNQKKVLKKLKEKYKKEKIRVAFSCYDCTKWKCESLYQLLLKDDNFHPFIIVSGNSANYKTHMTGVQNSDIVDTYNFFKNKNFEVFYAYDFEKNEPIPTKKFNPDIIFYQNPWRNSRVQGPVVTSEFALSCYVPYFITTSEYDAEWNLRFHQYLFRHYVINESTRKTYSAKMENKGANLKATGHTSLDYFYLNKDKEFQNENTVIYAPHWSCGYGNTLRWGTFLKNGEFILEYAKQHPEFNWIFKPHPVLKKYLRVSRKMPEEQTDNYWNRWREIGQIYESGDYLDMFMKSKMMITDCGTFLTEYLFTKKPVIHLCSSCNPTPYNDCVQNITSSYYQAHNIEELKNALDEVLVKNNDYKYNDRINAIKQTGYWDNYCALNILNDIKKFLGS